MEDNSQLSSISQPTDPTLVPTDTVQPKKSLLVPLLGVLIIFVSLFAGYMFVLNQKLSKQIVTLTSVSPSPVPTPEKTPDPTADWETYSENEIGFEYKLPKSVLLNKSNKGTDQLSLFLRVKDLNNYTDEPLGFALKTASADKIALEKGEFGESFGYSDSEKVIAIGTINAKTYLNFRILEVCDVRFERSLIFFKDNHQIIFTLSAPTNYADQLKDYFTLDSTSCGANPVWKSPDTFYNDLINQKAPQPAQDWYNLFDQIILTFKFLN